MRYQERVQRLQRYLRRKKIDAMLVAQPENRRYLSGFAASDHSIAESSGVVLVPATGQPWLLTDFRYQLQAEREVLGMQVEIYKRGLISLMAQLLPRLGIASLAFEAEYTLVATAEKLAAKLGAITDKLLPVSGVIERFRQIKDEEELAAVRRAVQLNEKVFGQVYETISPGQTELDIAMAIEQTMRHCGAERPSFSSIVASGDNSALPHAVPTPNNIQANRPLTIDMGLVLDGYCSDMTRTFVPGKADGRYRELHRLVRQAQLAGMAAVKAGVRCCDVDRAARSIIADAGYGDSFGHSLGHGVGLAVHEQPRVGSRSRTTLRAGMVVTIEPGIYIPGWGGIRLENMVVVTEDGSENLNHDTTWLDL